MGSPQRWWIKEEERRPVRSTLCWEWATLIGWFEGLAQERLWKQQRLDKRLYGQPFPNTQAVLLNLLSPSLKAT